MKADEVLRRYATGERNFSRRNLRGQSFKGKDLSEANFSEADIRGANFTNAKLTGANFSDAKAGLQRCGATGWVIVSSMLSALSGIFSTFLAYPVSSIFDTSNIENQNMIASWGFLMPLVALTVSGVVLIVTIRKGLVVGLGTVAALGAGAGAGAVGFGITGGFAQPTNSAMAGGAAVGLAVACAGAGVGLVAGAIAIAIAIAVAGALVGGSAMAGAMAGGIALTGLRGVGAVVFVLLSAYISWRALKGDERDAWVRTFAIAFAATGGTSFRGADLTNADFTSATLKSTDFRRANLTRTRWHQAKKLDLVRPGTTYLQTAQVRQLLITGQGQNKNFDRQNLRGVNLQGANLADASFRGADLSSANLQDADLSRAKLVQTQLDEADLTGATLTGATIEDWGITSHTKLYGVRCEYVFMRESTKEDPNPRRKPDNWNETFSDGDFADFIKPIVDTLDLYHNQDVDPRAIAISFKQLAENHPDAELRIVGMEVKGEDKFLLRAKTTPDADRSELSAEYFSTYNQLKALADCKFKSLIEEKDHQIRSLENMLETALQHPSFYLSNQIKEVTNMTNNPGGFSVGGSVGGDIRNLQGDKNRAIQGDNNQGVLGDNNQVTQGQGAATTEEPLTKEQVIELLAELDKLVRVAELPEDTKEEATMYLGAAKKATEKEEPKKETALANLQSVAETLETASKAANAGANVWDKAKPIIIKVATWLGAAAGSYFLGL